MATKNLIDSLTAAKTPLDGGQSSIVALLTAILIEARVQSQYLSALSSGIPLTDPPQYLRADEAVDPALIN